MNFAINDILGCNGEENSIIQDNLITKSSQKIKEFDKICYFNSFFLKKNRFSMRLINALASDYYGRTYLVSNEKTVIRLIGILKSEVL